MNHQRKLPIGIQDFESIRNDHYLYIDKTEYIYRLINSGKPFFLSRPRRFGKSLFLSTLRSYWEGKKELFHGLAIEELLRDDSDAFVPHPVFYFDFNKDDFTRQNALEDVLDEHLKKWEKEYQVEPDLPSLSGRFRRLIEEAVNQTGRNVVVLVDEYDKPLLEAMTNDVLEEHNKNVFKGFFSTLKSYDRYLKFVFLTGVTKFSKVSIFSDLNQLQDISMSRDYAEICGITETEMTDSFMPEIQQMALDLNITVPDCLSRLRDMYDGYHFHPKGSGIYNPFSLIRALKEREFGFYWFSTGTPTFLIKKLTKINFDAKRFTDGSVYADGNSLSDYRADNPDPIPLFYQTGYLTILDYDETFRSYQLGYPNNEVKYGFIESLAPTYLNQNENDLSPFDLRNFGRDILNADLDSLRDRLTALFARLPYTTDEKPVEQNFQNVIYIVFMLLGQFVQTEIHSAKGRADVIVETESYVYIFEFKRDESADAALAQIEEKHYARPYMADSRKLILIGANFNSEERTLDEWKVQA